MGEEEQLIINRMALVFPFRAVAMSTRRTHTALKNLISGSNASFHAV